MSLKVSEKCAGETSVITDEDLSDFNKGASKFDFLKERPKHVLVTLPCKRWKKVVKRSVIGVGIGAVGGGAVGFCVAGPGGIPPGAAVGAAAIGGLTAAASITLIYVKLPMIISADSTYRKWRFLKQRENLLKLFDSSVREHGELIELQCPISCDFPRFPMLAPCGHVYEKEEIEKHLDSAFSKKSCCSMKEGFRFTKSQLVFHPNHLLTILNRCLKVKSVLKDGEGDRILREGLDAVYEDCLGVVKKNAQFRLENLVNSAADVDGNIDEKLFQKEALEIARSMKVKHPKNKDK